MDRKFKNRRNYCMVGEVRMVVNLLGKAEMGRGPREFGGPWKCSVFQSGSGYTNVCVL